MVLKIPFNNCEINLILTWSDKDVLSNDTGATKFQVADTKIYVPAVTYQPNVIQKFLNN